MSLPRRSLVSSNSENSYVWMQLTAIRWVYESEDQNPSTAICDQTSSGRMKGYKEREFSLPIKVDVYRNLRNGCMSVKAREGKSVMLRSGLYIFILCLFSALIMPFHSRHSSDFSIIDVLPTGTTGTLVISFLFWGSIFLQL